MSGGMKQELSGAEHGSSPVAEGVIGEAAEVEVEAAGAPTPHSYAGGLSIREVLEAVESASAGNRVAAPNMTPIRVSFGKKWLSAVSRVSLL